MSIPKNLQKAYNRHESTTTIKIQAPDLGQTHKIFDGIKQICFRNTLPITWDRGVTVQTKHIQFSSH